MYRNFVVTYENHEFINKRILKWEYHTLKTILLWNYNMIDACLMEVPMLHNVLA